MASRWSYETRLLVLLSVANGVVALERLSAGFLSPFLVADLGLSNAQLGLLAGALSIAVAGSAVLFGQIANSSGARKRILVISTVAFSIISGAPALVGTFAMLLVARLLLGLAEGPVVPVGQAMMADVSSPGRRGFNMGFFQMGGSFLIGGMAGPVLATAVAESYGWRTAFSVSMVPGLIMALALALWVRPDPPRRAKPTAAERAARPSLLAAMAILWRVRNVRLSIIISALFAAWVLIQVTFLPVYLTEVKGLAPTVMGWVVGAGGAAGLVGGLGVPAISDRLGRRPVMIACCFLGLIAPVLILTLPPDPWLLGVAVLFGWMPMGISPLYIGVIPSESAPPALVTSAIGLSTGAGELVGGVMGPALAGLAADRFGLETPFQVCLVLAVICGLFALGLEETRPQRGPAAA